MTANDLGRRRLAREEESMAGQAEWPDIRQVVAGVVGGLLIAVVLALANDTGARDATSTTELLWSWFGVTVAAWIIPLIAVSFAADGPDDSGNVRRLQELYRSGMFLSGVVAIAVSGFAGLGAAAVAYGSGRWSLQRLAAGRAPSPQWRKWPVVSGALTAVGILGAQALL